MHGTDLQIALCAAQLALLRTALCMELPALAQDGKVPGWVQLLPPGVKVQGVDGRSWVNDQPQAVAANSRVHQDPPVDFEHATHLRAPQGEKAPAAGWIEKMEAREGGAIWGFVNWTPAGQAAVANREYRYLSPVLRHEKATGRIVAIESVGLVNKPNLHLAALNRAEEISAEENPKEEPSVNLLQQLISALGLAANATEDLVLSAIRKLQSDHQLALNRAEHPPLDKFVPKSEYDAALNRAGTAEGELKKIRDAAKAQKIDELVGRAVKEGKVTPASKDYFLAMCRKEGGVEEFEKYLGSAPVIAKPSGLEDRPAPETGVALNSEEQKISKMFGNSAEDLKKYAAFSSA